MAKTDWENKTMRQDTPSYVRLITGWYECYVVRRILTFSVHSLKQKSVMNQDHEGYDFEFDTLCQNKS